MTPRGGGGPGDENRRTISEDSLSNKNDMQQTLAVTTASLVATFRTGDTEIFRIGRTQGTPST
ncbi:MAG: hypothetical protein U0790_06815 [Isosphaeraceae bacterium]